MTSIENPNQRNFALNNGDGEIPALGFGTLVSDTAETRNATKAAVEAGFRHLDCAERYRNEEEVGAALKELFAEGTVRREDLFVTTKLWNNNHRPERVKPALQASLNRLGLDSVDLYLVHTPFAFQPGDDQDPRDPHGAVVYDDGVTLDETWTAMESLVDEGLSRAIGLSDIDAEGTRKIVERRPDQAGRRRGRVAPLSPAVGPARILHDRGHHPVGIRSVGPRYGTASARRSSRRLDGSALWKDAGTGASGLGHSARQRRPDVIGQARPHRRELRRDRASRERDPGDQRARNTHPVQFRRRRGRARIHRGAAGELTEPGAPS